jgi:hypothetical protein
MSDGPNGVGRGGWWQRVADICNSVKAFFRSIGQSRGSSNVSNDASRPSVVVEESRPLFPQRSSTAEQPGESSRPAEFSPSSTPGTTSHSSPLGQPQFESSGHPKSSPAPEQISATASSTTTAQTAALTKEEKATAKKEAQKQIDRVEATINDLREARKKPRADTAKIDGWIRELEHQKTKLLNQKNFERNPHEIQKIVSEGINPILKSAELPGVLEPENAHPETMSENAGKSSPHNIAKGGDSIPSSEKISRKDPNAIYSTVLSDLEGAHFKIDALWDKAGKVYKKSAPKGAQPNGNRRISQEDRKEFTKDLDKIIDEFRNKDSVVYQKLAQLSILVNKDSTTYGDFWEGTLKLVNLKNEQMNIIRAQIESAR